MYVTTRPAAGLRLATLSLGLVAVCAAGTGVGQVMLFAKPSDLKYAVTVAVPLLVASVLASREPIVSASFILIVLAPFGGFDSTLSGVQVPLIAPLCIGALLVALLCPGEHARASFNPIPLLLVGGLLVVPLMTGSSPGHYLVLFGTIGGVAFVVARACARPRGTERVLAALVTAAVIQAAIELWQLRTGHALNIYGTAGTPVLGRDYFYRFENVFRPSGALYDPISLGNLLAIALPASLALSLRAHMLSWRLTWAAAGTVITLGLVLTLSRMSWIGGFAGVLLVVMLERRGRLKIAIGIAGAVVIVLAASMVVDGSSLSKRLASVVAPTASTTANHTEDVTRTRIWAAAESVIEQHPVAGVGFGQLHHALASSYPDSRPGVHAHSTYLQMLGEGGALAGLALAFVLLATGLTAARAVRREVPYATALTGSLVATLICWSTDYTVRYLAVAATFSVVFGAIAAFRNVQAARGLVGA